MGKKCFCFYLSYPMLNLISRKVKFDVVVEGQPYIQSLPSLAKAIGCFFYLCFVAGLYYPEVGWGLSHFHGSCAFPGAYRIVWSEAHIPSFQKKIISPPPRPLNIYFQVPIFLPSFLPFFAFFVSSSIFPLSFLLFYYFMFSSLFIFRISIPFSPRCKGQFHPHPPHRVGDFL
jgi:hypothetical protein